MTEPLAGRLPSVSVLVPTYDREHLLPATLQAILGQHYDGDIEVVLTYDKNEPNQAHATDAPGRTVKVIANTRTSGLAGARNSGALAAGGELVALCDDDDVWLPGKLAKQVALMQTTGAPTCVTGIYVVQGDKRTARVPGTPRLTLQDFVEKRVVEASPSTVLVRRDAFLGPIGLVDEQIPGSYGEDWDWLLRAAQVGPVVVVDEPLVDIVWHTGSFFRTRWATIIESFDYLLAKHAVLRESGAGLAYIYGRKAFAYAALGDGAAARHWAKESLRRRPTEKRPYLATLVSLKVLPADLVMRLAASAGRGM
jgi:glycosyltransferase involved in cell wall biosynthesis